MYIQQLIYKLSGRFYSFGSSDAFSCRWFGFFLLWCFLSSFWSCYSWLFLVCSDCFEPSIHETGSNSLGIIVPGVGAMKTDEILMAIVAAKLLGLFKNDQQHKQKPLAHPIPVAIPRPPFSYSPPIYFGNGCNRPKKCRKSLPKYFDSYDDDIFDGSYEDDSYASDPYDDDLYGTGSIDISDAGVYARKYRTSYLSPTSSSYPMPDNNYEDSIDIGSDGNTNGGKSIEYYQDNQSHTIYDINGPQETAESDEQISSATKEYENITPVPKRKKLRKYFESKLNSFKPTKSTINKIGKLRTTKTSKRKKQKRNQKLNWKPNITPEQEVQYEYMTTEPENLTESPPETQQQVIHLGEKPSGSHFQQEKEEQVMEQEELEKEAMITESATVVQEITESETTSATTVASIMTINGYHDIKSSTKNHEQPKKLIVSYTYKTVEDDNIDDPKVLSESNDKHNSQSSSLLLQNSETKIINQREIVPKTVRKYLDRIKLWNKKRWNKQSNDKKSKYELMSSNKPHDKQQNAAQVFVEKSPKQQQTTQIVPSEHATIHHRNPMAPSHTITMYPIGSLGLPPMMQIVPPPPLPPPQALSSLMVAPGEIVEEQHVVYPLTRKSDNNRDDNGTKNNKKTTKIENEIS